MKTGLVSASFICAVFATSSIADNNKSTPTKDSHIETAADIQYWCKKESYRYFKRKKLTPYNWSVTTIRILNDYHSTGSWRVKSRLIEVSCSIRKGRKAKYTKIEIID
jgi:hypothetical protein